MNSIDALGNLDIWTEVLRYFQISLTQDSDADIKEKRNALFRIALLSPSLTTPALDVLWGTMTSLEPVVRVINSKSAAPENDFLFFQADNQGGHWLLRKPLTSEDIRDRAYDYLSRIQRLRVAIGSTKETGVWSILSLTLGMGPTAPLLPSIKSLSLDLSQVSVIGPWMYAIRLLLSPTLTAISYNAPSSVLRPVVKTLHSALCSQSLSLNHITYHGYPSASFLHTCLSFGSLKTLRLSYELGRSGFQRYASGVSIANVFEMLRYLVDLEIDLRFFPLRSGATPPPARRPEIVPSPVLERLSITGNYPDIGEFLLDGIKSSSLQSLKVSIFDPTGLTWKVICDRIATNFPQLHSLSFRRAGTTVVPQMLMQDLSSLISRPTMRSLQLSGISHCLTEGNICGLLDSWPSLHTLAITNDYTIHFPASVLVWLSQASHLRNIKLPLGFAFIQEDLPVETTPISCSQIRELTFTSVSSPPPNLEGKVKLARNLLMLFPLLERILTDSSSHQAYLGELEKLVGSFHGIIVMYLGRRDKERRMMMIAKDTSSSSERKITI